MKNHIFRMVEWMAWADARVLAALAATPAACDEALPLAAHVLAAEHVWLARLEDRQPQVAVWPTLSLAECHELARENADGYRRYLDGLDEARLGDAVEYRNQAGNQFKTSAIDILMQVLTHGPYHRGQIAKIFGRLGIPAAETDYIHYVRYLADSGA
jgi:uncharacterized damage-inducible protein DinB